MSSRRFVRSAATYASDSSSPLGPALRFAYPLEATSEYDGILMMLDNTDSAQPGVEATREDTQSLTNTWLNTGPVMR
jgi:hypothetical protein